MKEELETIVDKYIRGEDLSSTENAVFQAAMKDVEFSNEVSTLRAIQEAAGVKDRAKMKDLLVTQEKSYQRQSKLKKYLLLIVAVILALFLFFMLKPSPEVPEMLYATYYQPYPNVIDPLTKGDNDLNGFQLYEQKKYHEAIAYFNKKEVLNEEDHLYLGFSYLSIDDLKSAQNYWQKIQSEKYNDVIQWYTALICLKEASSSCKSLFQAIANSDSVYKNQAVQILEKIY